MEFYLLFILAINSLMLKMDFVQKVIIRQNNPRDGIIDPGLMLINDSF